MAANGINGFHSAPHRPLRAGIYAPIPTFFQPDTEALDIPSFEAHVARVANAGVFPLLAGSMGEAPHLSRLERVSLIKAARKVLDANNLTNIPLVVGTGVPSTRESIELCEEAAEAGADYAIVIASGYYAGALTTDALRDFFTEVAQKSPIPIILYNYPGASGGIDLDSDVISELAQTCSNICGVKLTCGNVGKLTRIADNVSQPGFFTNRDPLNKPFLVLGGFIDFLTPSIFANAHGAITGLGNVAPHAIVKLFQLSEASRKDLSHLPEAQRLQGIIARADNTIAKASIAGTKVLLEKMYGYGGVPRRPLPPISSSAAQALWDHPHTQALVKVERELSGKTLTL